jgi:2-succinyl-5-enolpyruvyl-6-hydroxy-3-cyclohexene-1-carboxylate synthase
MSAVLLTEWARLLIDSLVQSGVQNVVVSPGSRSTPFTWAALEHPGLRARSVIDERSAAFVALGQARVTAAPSLLIATSGSAPAHYLPAIVEAAYSHVPIIVLSADRPSELLYRDAPQTIDQRQLFGSMLRGSFALGNPEAHDSALRALQSTAAQAVRLALEPDPGPVHINAPARKPLAPASRAECSTDSVSTSVTQLIERGPTRFSPARWPSSPSLVQAYSDAQRARRGVIACGALPAADPEAPGALLELARVTRFPIFAEAPSQLLFGQHSPQVLAGFDTFLRATKPNEFNPDLVLEFGRPLTSSHWAQRQQAFQQCRRHIVAPDGWPDVPASADWLHRCKLSAFAQELARQLARPEPASQELSGPRGRWLEALQGRKNSLQDASKRVLASSPFGEAHVVHQVCNNVPEGSLLVIGNSLPLRAVEAFAAPRSAGIVTLVQRGANGIDGLVSGAAGAASCRPQAPTTLLIGDVSLAHDVGGLQVARRATTPLVMVVIDNAGGRIFDELPWGAAARASTEMRDFWLTPPMLDYVALARAHGIAFAEATSRAELESALKAAYAHWGATLLVARVPPNSYHTAIEQLRQLSAERVGA